MRRPGVKSASSSLNVALFAEKFNPFSPQYENPDTAVSLQKQKKKRMVRLEIWDKIEYITCAMCVCVINCALLSDMNGEWKNEKQIEWIVCVFRAASKLLLFMWP